MSGTQATRRPHPQTDAGRPGEGRERPSKAPAKRRRFWVAVTQVRSPKTVQLPQPPHLVWTSFWNGLCRPEAAGPSSPPQRLGHCASRQVPGRQLRARPERRLDAAQRPCHTETPSPCRNATGPGPGRHASSSATNQLVTLAKSPALSGPQRQEEATSEVPGGLGTGALESQFPNSNPPSTTAASWVASGRSPNLAVPHL